MSRPDMTTARHDETSDAEIQLLDAEIFETPRRLSRSDALDQIGGLPDRRPFDQPDPEDDR